MFFISLQERKQNVDVFQWLQSINYPQYYEPFVENGFDDLNFFHDLSVNDLTIIGIPKDHSIDVSYCYFLYSIWFVTLNAISFFNTVICVLLKFNVTYCFVFKKFASWLYSPLTVIWQI